MSIPSGLVHDYINTQIMRASSDDVPVDASPAAEGEVPLHVQEEADTEPKKEGYRGLF